MIEEFICANIWPLSTGWDPNPMGKLRVRASKETVPFPKFALVKLPGKSNEAIVSEVEERAADLAGPYLSKEHDSFVVCCPGGSRVNQYFFVMGVKYPGREEPMKPEKRSKGVRVKIPPPRREKILLRTLVL